MKKKLISLTLIFSLLLNYLQSTNLEIKWIQECYANESIAKKLKREDIERFEGRIVTSIRHTVIINDNDEADIIGGMGVSNFNKNEWKEMIKVDAGHYSTIGLKKDGTVVSCGDVLDKNWENIIDVASGDYHIVAVKNDGTVIARGENGNGQCNVSQWSNISKVTAGNGHTVGLRNDRTVIATGNNYSGQCNVSEWNDIVQVSAGRTHTVGLKSDGTVVATGSNYEGECNVNEWTDIIAISAGNDKTIALKSDGTVVATGYNVDGINDWKNVVSISAGESVVALKSDGRVVGAGNNDYGEINMDYWDDIKSISAGQMYTVGLKSDGTVVINGENYQGSLNAVNGWRNIVQIDGGNYNIVGLKSDGTVVDTMNDVNSWGDIIQVSAGNSHTVGLRKDGTVIATGENNYGELNVESWTNIVQVSAGNCITAGLRKDGTVIATGANNYGQCNVKEWKGIIKIDIIDRHIVGLKSDGTVVAAGENYYGQCNVEQLTNIVDIAAGYCHTVALKSDGTVVAIGRSEIGACNVDTWKNVETIAAGDHHTIGITKNGDILATGDSRSGQCSFLKKLDNVINIDKQIYKINEPIDINVNNTSFYNTYDKSIKINEKIYKLIDNDKKYYLQYTPLESGEIDVELPGTIDLFGNSYTKRCLAKVIPLNSIKSNKSFISNGEKITLNIKFDKPVSSDFTISLSGGISSNQIKVNEINGSNGTEYMVSYVVPNQSSNGDVDVTLHNVTDSEGIYYKSYTEKNVFNKNQITSPIQSITASKTENKIGDIVEIIVNFTESVKSGVKLNLDGAIEQKDVVMQEVEGSNGTQFKYSYYITDGKDGQVDVTIDNVYNLNGILYGEYIEKGLFNVYSTRPNVVEIISSHKSAKLDDIIRFVATFNKPIKEQVLLSLGGDLSINELPMIPVDNSNNTQYYYEYKVTEDDLGEINYVKISNMEDLYGNIGYDYYKYNELCKIDGKAPKVTNIEMDSLSYKQGDIASIAVTFDEPIKQGVKATLLEGDKVLQEISLSPIEGSNNTQYESFISIDTGYSCNVDILISDIEDEVGNISNYNQENIFKIIGNEKPVITANDVAIKVGDEFNSLDNISASDKEDGDITSKIKVIENTVDTTKPGKYKVVYSVEDSYGNVVTKEIVVTVNLRLSAINTAPIIKANDITLKVGDKFDEMSGVSATDNEDGDLTSKTEVLENTVDTKKVGEYKVVYKVTDSQGASSKKAIKVVVRSNEKPVITAEDSTLKVGDKFDEMSGVSASDKEDGDITSKIKVIENTVDTQNPGKYKVVYSVEDSDGNVVTKEIVVTVNPKLSTINTAPIIKSNDITLKVGDKFDEMSGVSATDKEDGDLTSKIEVVENTVDTKKVGEYKVVYKVTDSQGASSKKTIKVVVRSNEKPVIIAKNIVLTVGDKFDVMSEVSASDKEDGNITSNIKVVENTVNILKAGKYKAVYSVTDNDGNIVKIERIITVNDLKIENVKAISTSYNSNKITWGKVSKANGYEVYRSTSKNGTYKSIKTITNGNKVSYTNTSLATGTTYYYKVRAYRTVNGKKVYSNYSGVVSAKPILSLTTAKATSASYNSNKITWSKVSGANGYEVYRSTSKNGTYKSIKTITSGSTLSYTNTSLATGTTYYYKVRAYRTVNGKKVYSNYSVVVSAKPALSNSSVTLTAGTKKVTVKWKKISGASGYEVYRSTSKSGKYTNVKTITKGSTVSFTNSSLTKNKTYYYKVRAYRLVNGKKVYSSYSSVKSVKTK